MTPSAAPAPFSVTVDAELVDFVDALPGTSRSAKIEGVLGRFRAVTEDQQLRRALAEAFPDGEADPL